MVIKSLPCKVYSTMPCVCVHQGWGEGWLDDLKAEGLQQRHVLLGGEGRGGLLAQARWSPPLALLAFVYPVLVLVEVGLGAEGLTTEAADELLLHICLDLRPQRRGHRPGGRGGGSIAGWRYHLHIIRVRLLWRLELVHIGQFAERRVRLLRLQMRTFLRILLSVWTPQWSEMWEER